MKHKKSPKIPWILWIIHWFFPTLERLLPGLAARSFFKIFFTPLRYPVPDKELEIAKRASQLHVLIGKKKITVYEWGESHQPYILLVHGWAGRATQFRKFVLPLQEAGYRVIGFDGPAHGQSQGKSTHIMEFGVVLKHLVSVKGIPVAVIAHSFGGPATLYSIMKGLPVSKVINIASPTIADEILRTFLKAINGSWKTAESFKKLIAHRFQRPFEEFASLYFIRHVPDSLRLLLIHDDQDKDVPIEHAHALMKIFPSAQLLATSGLGHTRILKDDEVIAAAVAFIQK